MIEYRLAEYSTYTSEELPMKSWTVIPQVFKPRPDDFNNLDFKINGVVYHEWNEEFETALIWDKLNGD